MSLFVTQKMNWQLIISLALCIWLLVLTVVLFFLFSFFKKLSKSANEKDIRKLLDKILGVQVKNTEGIEKLNKITDRLNDEGFGHVQKIGLVRFNPFREIGGDHSFSLAILDGKDTGIIITGLHTRERTRIYAKSVKAGKSEIELSEEERKAYLKAQRS